MTTDAPRTDPLTEAAWGLIANSGGGDWTTQTQEWQEAAALWRDDYHAALDATRAPRSDVPSHPSPGESAGFDALVDDLRAEFDQGHFMPWDEIIARVVAALPATPPSPDVEGLGVTERGTVTIESDGSVSIHGWTINGDAVALGDAALTISIDALRAALRESGS